MTLVVAIATEHGTWMGGERVAGDFTPTTLAGPKIFELVGDGYHFSIGFAGSPRVAQTILAVHPPDRRSGSLEWWLTEYCDRIHERCRDQGLMRDPGSADEVHLAGHSGAIVALEGRVFLVDHVLCWEEPANGYVATGGAYDMFWGAFEALRDGRDPVDAARLAWPIVQRRCRIGDLVDEITLAKAADDG